jgi:hypothetical protein
MIIANALKITVVLFVAFIPFIAYIDFHLFKKHMVCTKCGYNEFNKQAFLLACTLEGFMFIMGCLLGLLFGG